MSPTPRASRARKALVHVVNANPDARSAGDDSSTRHRTPFLHDTRPPARPSARQSACMLLHWPPLAVAGARRTATAANKTGHQIAELCRGVACLCNPRAVARPARPAPAMTMSSTASCIGCGVVNLCLVIWWSRRKEGRTEEGNRRTTKKFRVGSELLMELQELSMMPFFIARRCVLSR